MHFLQDIVMPRVMRILWDTASVELRERVLRQALTELKTKWDDAQVRRVAERAYDES
jgi:hypothetical protein